MRYKILYVDGSEEFVQEDSIADARREANCLYNCPVKSIIAQDQQDCDDAGADATEEDIEEDEGEGEDDEEEDEE
jgi:hypothetical protein